MMQLSSDDIIVYLVRSHPFVRDYGQVHATSKNTKRKTEKERENAVKCALKSYRK